MRIERKLKKSLLKKKTTLCTTKYSKAKQMRNEVSESVNGVGQRQAAANS